MASCVICGSSLNFLNSRKINNGQICVECSSKIPRAVRGDTTAYTDF